MSKKRIHLFQDILWFAVSVSFAIFIVKTNIADQFITALVGPQWFKAFIAGMFFTSVFTTVPAVALLGTLAETTTLFTLAVFGSLGAVLGDYVIFFFVKNRVLADINYLLTFSKKYRFFLIFKTHLFKFFMPLLGALIIASPFPDEIGVTMLGLSKIKNRNFFLLSLLFNGLGIFFIGWIAKKLLGI